VVLHLESETVNGLNVIKAAMNIKSILFYPKPSSSLMSDTEEQSNDKRLEIMQQKKAIATNPLKTHQLKTGSSGTTCLLLISKFLATNTSKSPEHTPEDGNTNISMTYSVQDPRVILISTTFCDIQRLYLPDVPAYWHTSRTRNFEI